MSGSGLVNARRAYEMAGAFSTARPIIIGMDPRTMVTRAMRASDNDAISNSRSSGEDKIGNKTEDDIAPSVVSNTGDSTGDSEPNASISMGSSRITGASYKPPSALCLYQWADSHSVFCMDRALRIFDGGSPLTGPGLSWETALKTVRGVYPLLWTQDVDGEVRSAFKDLWTVDAARAAFFLVRLAGELEYERLEDVIHGDVTEDDAITDAISNDDSDDDEYSDDELRMSEIIMKTRNMVDPRADDMDVVDASSVDSYGSVKVSDLHMGIPGSWSDWTDELDDAGMGWSQWLTYRRAVAVLGDSPDPIIARRVTDGLAMGAADYASTIWRLMQTSSSARAAADELSWWCVDRDWSRDGIIEGRVAIALLDSLISALTTSIMPSMWSHAEDAGSVDYAVELGELAVSDTDNIMSTIARTWSGLRALPEWAADNSLVTDDEDVSLVFSHLFHGEIGWYSDDAASVFRMYQALTWPTRMLNDRMSSIFKDADSDSSLS